MEETGVDRIDGVDFMNSVADCGPFCSVERHCHVGKEKDDRGGQKQEINEINELTEKQDGDREEGMRGAPGERKRDKLLQCRCIWTRVTCSYRWWK